MRMSVLVLIGVAVTQLMSSARAQDKVNPPGKDTEEPTQKIKELQKERIAALKKVVDGSVTLFQASRIEYTVVWEAKISLLKAELETAEKESERIALYKEMLESLKQYEEYVTGRFKSGLKGALEMDVYKAKARRLEVEIILEQAKVKEAKERK